MKFGICNEIFQGWSLEDTFAYAKKAGYDCVEIAPFTIAKSVTDIPRSERTRIKEMAAHIGIGISGIHWVLVQTEGLYLTHPDAAVQEKTARYFVEGCGNRQYDLGGRQVPLPALLVHGVQEGLFQLPQVAGRAFEG